MSDTSQAQLSKLSKLSRVFPRQASNASQSCQAKASNIKCSGCRPRLALTPIPRLPACLSIICLSVCLSICRPSTSALYPRCPSQPTTHLAISRNTPTVRQGDGPVAAVHRQKPLYGDTGDTTSSYQQLRETTTDYHRPATTIPLMY